MILEGIKGTQKGINKIDNWGSSIEIHPSTPQRTPSRSTFSNTMVQIKEY